MQNIQGYIRVEDESKVSFFTQLAKYPPNKNMTLKLCNKKEAPSGVSFLYSSQFVCLNLFAFADLVAPALGDDPLPRIDRGPCRIQLGRHFHHIKSDDGQVEQPS